MHSEVGGSPGSCSALVLFAAAKICECEHTARALHTYAFHITLVTALNKQTHIKQQQKVLSFHLHASINTAQKLELSTLL